MLSTRAVGTSCSAVLLLFSCILLLQSAAAYTGGPIKVCVPAQQSPAQLGLCTAALSGANVGDIQFTCVAGGSLPGCFRQVADKTADIVSATGEQAFTANQRYGIVPVLGEGLPGRDNLSSYYSVAVVNAAFCEGNNKTYADLAGLNSCHTGYQRTAGWDFAVGALLSTGTMQRVSDVPNIADDAESVAAFFGNVCAARGSTLTINAPVVNANGTGSQWEELCGACQGPCNSDDDYWSYEGVVRGVTEGACDVGFTNNTVFTDYTLGGRNAQPWSTKPASDFRILCRSGGCAPVDQFSTCSNARGPGRAILASADFAQPALAATTLAMQNALVAAAQNATFLAGASNINGVDNFFLSNRTDRLTAFTPGVEDFLDEGALGAYRALNEDPTYFNGTGNTTFGRASMCTASEEEEIFCLNIAALFNSTDTGFGWTCDMASNVTAGCPASVAAGETDLTVTGSAALFTAYRDYNLRAVLAEDSGSGEAATYYSVGIVKAAYCDTPDAELGFAGLRGKSMCATGYGRTAGWVMPIGYLSDQGLVNTTASPTTVPGLRGDAQAAANFFGDICAANNNTQGPVLPPGQNFSAKWADLCTACKEPATCSTDDDYWSYEGVLRGVVEGACQVGFTKQDIIPQYIIGGEEAEAWAPNPSDYRLLCPGGGCSPVDEYAECTAAKVPARAVLVRPDQANVRELQSALIQLAANPDVREALFNETNNPEGYVFQTSVETFIPIESSTPAYLGAAGRSIQGLDVLRATEVQPAGASSAGRR
ncbi:hypothetical protein ABBQ38_011798 [Trebouxia sp. C0009 RCD-2024]